MIKDNIVYFGYGTIGVFSDAISSCLCFRHIKPPQEIGKGLAGKEYEVISEVYFDVNNYYNDIILLDKQLDSLKDLENKQIEFCNYILDFNQYNEKSVNVVKNAITNAISLYLQALAC